MALGIKIRVDDLTSAIMDELETYTRSVVDGMNEVGDRVSKAGVKLLRQLSPKKRGKYAKGWRVKKEEAFLKPTQYILHNQTHYSLAHLLEKGHAKRTGGRVGGKTHIAPVEDEMIDQYTKGVEEVIKNGR